MRRHVAGLENPHPMTLRMPAIFQQDDFTVRWVSGFDDVLAPIISTLDNLEAYHDPGTAPPDFLRWLSTWLAVELDETWPESRQREVVREVSDLYRWRGTARGLTRLVEIYTGYECEVTDSGGVAVSEVPGGEPPGDPTPRLTVRVRPPPGVTVDEGRLHGIVAAAKPAHVPHTVEVVAT